MGIKASVKKELELTEEDTENQDLIISLGKININLLILGGDSSYLRAAGMIRSRSTPILGINSDPTRRTGALLNEEIDFNN